MRRRVPEIPGPRLSARKRQISVKHLLPRAPFFFDAEPLSPRRFGEAHRSKLLRFVVDHDVDDRGMVRALPRNHGNETTETRVPPSFSFARDVGVRRRRQPTRRRNTEKKALTTPYVSRLSYVRRFISAFACAAVLDACFLCVVVGRAKKCLDFAATTYLVHFASCCAVAGVPKGAGWWVTTGVALSVTAILGEYLCVSRELRDIPVAGGR